MTWFAIRAGALAVLAGLLLPASAAFLVGAFIIGWAALHTEVGDQQ